ncbi:cytochrome c, partial [Escherichia coli]|nr:cytochrome c [Escherichia coli]
MNRRIVAGLVIAAIVVAVAGFALVWRPSLPKVVESATAFPPGEIQRGQTLAEAGFCSTCHTSANGAYLAGGRPL